MSSQRRAGPRRVRSESPVLVVLVRRGAELATWPLAGADRADLSVLDELARWQLAARRAGCGIRLRHAGADLSGLLDLVGLDSVLRETSREPEHRHRLGLLRETSREPEGAEEPGVQEVVVPDDPRA